MGETVEIAVEGRDNLSGPMRAAGGALKDLQGHARSTQGVLAGLGNALLNAATSAAGFASAMYATRAIDATVGAITGMFGSMIDANAQMETMSQSFKILLSDAAAAGSLHAEAIPPSGR